MSCSWNDGEFKKQRPLVAEESAENTQQSLIQKFDSAEFHILRFQWLLEPNNRKIHYQIRIFSQPFSKQPDKSNSVKRNSHHFQNVKAFAIQETDKEKQQHTNMGANGGDCGKRRVNREWK